MDSRTKFTVFMIISEVVITAIAFIGAYYIFKLILDKNKKAREEKDSESNDAAGPKE